MGTKIYHPNIDKLGRICLDILKDKWSPALQIRTVLLSIQALLSAPNPDDPLANDVAEQWKNNEVQAIETAKQWTRIHAQDKWQDSQGSHAFFKQSPYHVHYGVIYCGEDMWNISGYMNCNQHVLVYPASAS